MLHLLEVENGSEDFELHAQQRGTTGKHVTEAAKSKISAACCIKTVIFEVSLNLLFHFIVQKPLLKVW